MQWIDALSRPIYKDLIIENLKYCKKEKGLDIYAWCIISNHMHLIVARKGEQKIEDIIRDFKKYTAVKMISELEENPHESRKELMLWMFRKLAEKSAKHQKHCFWQNEYHPIELSDS